MAPFVQGFFQLMLIVTDTPMPEYDAGDLRRKIDNDGYFAFQGKRRKISQAYAGYQIARHPKKDDGRWMIGFASRPVAVPDITAENRKDQTVRPVAGQMSDISPD